MKKFLSAIMAMAMAFSCITVAFAAEVTVPDGVTAKTLSLTEAVEIPVSDAAYSGQKKSAGTDIGGNNAGVYPEFPYSQGSYNGSIYVDAPQAGKYKVVISIMDKMNVARTLNIKVNDDATVSATTPIVNRTWTDTIFEEVNLDEGVNKLTVTGDGNTKWCKATVEFADVIEDDTAGDVPAGVTPATLSLTEAVEVNVTDAAFSGQTQTGQLAGQWMTPEFPYANAGTNSSIYVDAPQAGEYKVAFTTIDTYNETNRTMTVTVNDDADTAVAVTAATAWQAWATTEVTLVLNEGVNKITVSGNGNTKWYKATVEYVVTDDGDDDETLDVAAKALSLTETVEVNVTDAAFSGQTQTGELAGQYMTPDFAYTNAGANSSIYVDAPQAGPYSVAFTTIDAYNDSSRNMIVTVNDDADTAVTTKAANGWQTWMATEVILVLDKGVNKITVSGNGSTKWYKAAFTKAISIASEATEGKQILTWEGEAKGAAEGYTTANTNPTANVYVEETGVYTISISYVPKWDDKVGSVTVNGTEVFGFVSEAANEIDNASCPDKDIKAHATVTQKVTLTKGANKITYTLPNSCCDKIELANFDLQEMMYTEGKTGDAPTYDGLVTGSWNAVNAVYFRDITELSETPWIYKSAVSTAIPADGGVKNVYWCVSNMQGNGMAKGLLPFFAAAYDEDGKLLDVSMTYHYMYDHNIAKNDLGDLDLTGAATVKVMVFRNLDTLKTVSSNTITK